MTNQRIGKIGATVTGAATAAFALSMLVELISGVPMATSCT